MALTNECAKALRTPFAGEDLITHGVFRLFSVGKRFGGFKNEKGQALISARAHRSRLLGSPPDLLPRLALRGGLPWALF